MTLDTPIRAALLGTGNIGVDLGIKLARDPRFDLVAAIGRRAESPGLRRLETISRWSTADGLSDFVLSGPPADVLFDATSAGSHREHWRVLEHTELLTIDLTPSRIGIPTVPGMPSISSSHSGRNHSMITCGGQASLPLIDAIAGCCESVDYVEVSSSIASRSAGAATRINLDDYILATEQAARLASGAGAAKAILILNPVEPPTIMRTTVQMLVKGLHENGLQDAIQDVIVRVREYVPGYELAFDPVIQGDLVTLTVKVTGAGDFLPSWAGNLDIITAAAVRSAAELAVGSALD